MLHTLALNLLSNSVGASGAQALAALKEARLLRTLTLNLSAYSTEASGAQALAAVKEVPSLHTLTLNIYVNSIGASGAQALAALKKAPLLHTLTVNLDTYFNGVSTNAWSCRICDNKSLNWQNWDCVDILLCVCVLPGSPGTPI